MRYLWIGFTTLFFVAAAGIPIYLWSGQAAPQDPDDEPAEGLLQEESHYYVFLTVIEVDPKDHKGSSWDPGGAPDLAYEIRWQGLRVFESTTKDNTLVAKWTNVSLKARDLLGTFSIDDSIKAARITARPGDVLEFSVYDKDRTSGDDLVGSWSVEVSTLRLGDQTWERPGGRIRSVACRVLPLDGMAFETLTR